MAKNSLSIPFFFHSCMLVRNILTVFALALLYEAFIFQIFMASLAIIPGPSNRKASQTKSDMKQFSMNANTIDQSDFTLTK